MHEDMNLQLPLGTEIPLPPPPTETEPPAKAGPAAAPAPPTDGVLTEWKEALRRDFERWLETVDAIPADTDLPAEPETPDLYTFHEQLAALGAESRRANRKTAEVFSQWAETLGKFDAELARLREQLSESARDDDRLARGHCLLLVELLDRLRRIQSAFETPSPKHWWSRGDEHWRKAWETQRQAFDIVIEHLEAWLQQEGVARIETIDEPFDPQTMVAVAAVPDAQRPHQTVIEEIAAGYLRDDELLRVAQVKVTLNKENS